MFSFKYALMKLSQTSVMCSIMVGLSPHQISPPRLLVIVSYRELHNMPLSVISLQLSSAPRLLVMKYDSYVPACMTQYYNKELN